MYLRTVRVSGDPEDLEKAITAFDHASAPLRRLPGCAAVALMVDRKVGQGIALSYWEKEAALKASEEASADARALITAERRLEVIDVECYEVALLERRQPLKEGTYARIITGRGEPARVDQVGRGMRDRALSIVKRQRGFRSVVGAFNRQNGRVLAGSCWESADDRRASETPLAPVRQEVMESVGAGASMMVENFEVVFADIRVAAGVS
jgi:heme-degrading monooxygenase HmoA